uniref:Uncharacterized protein n=2 Tax=Dunaliella tertiolecta TaxID=3047 RepID=A0A7S3VPS7_DUNTE
MMSTATNLMATASNFALGIPACVLLCLAHNRRRTLPSPSAAAAVAGEQQVDTRAVVDTRPTATQSTVVPEGEAKGSAGQGHSLVSTPFGGLAFTTSHPSQSLRPSAQPAPSDLTLLLASMCCNPSLVAWVQRAELWLLTSKCLGGQPTPYG